MGLISRVSSRTYRGRTKTEKSAMASLTREGDQVRLSRYPSQPSVKPPPITYMDDDFISPKERYIMSLKPEDIELGYMDVRICDLIPKGPNSPNKEHNLWGRRKSAMNPLNDFENSCRMAGRMKFMLFSKDVPKTVQNFKELIKEKDGTGYVHTNFHSIVPGFMVQGGDTEHQNGRGGVSIYGRNMPDENFKVEHTHKGMLGMANMGPNTNGSQFYITQRPTPWLDGEHVVFGKIVDGFKVLKQIDDTCGSKNGLPTKFVQITKCGMFKKKGNVKQSGEELGSVAPPKVEEPVMQAPTNAEPSGKRWWKVW